MSFGQLVNCNGNYYSTIKNISTFSSSKNYKESYNKEFLIFFLTVNKMSYLTYSYVIFSHLAFSIEKVLFYEDYKNEEHMKVTLKKLKDLNLTGETFKIYTYSRQYTSTTVIIQDVLWGVGGS